MTMLKHYLERTSELEFGERNSKIPELVLKEKSAINTRGVLPSTMTLTALAGVCSGQLKPDTLLRPFSICEV